MRLVAPLLSVALLPACLVDGAGPDHDTFTSAATASRLVDHGVLAFGGTASVSLTSAQRQHVWDFTLPAPAHVVIRTGPGPAGRDVDTVLTLEREGRRGWGSPISNDDADGVFSAVERDLVAGHYRIRVEGYRASIRGDVTVTLGCAGEGCPAPTTCAFGDTFHGIDRTRFAFGDNVVLTAASPLSALDAAQVVRAVQASSHTDVTTPAEAFARVDQGEINRLEMRDAIGVRLYVAYEYGAGDSSYGAIFLEGEREPSAEIHDGDITECTVTAAACLFGQLYGDLPEGVSTVAEATIVAGTAIDAVTEAQILAAARLQLPGIALPALFELVTDGEVRRRDVRHDATGRAYTFVTYILGDHRWGAAFVAGTAEIAVEIEDNVLARCDAF